MTRTRRVLTRIGNGILLGAAGLFAGTAIFGNWTQGGVFGIGAAVLTWAGFIKIEVGSRPEDGSR